MEQDLEGEVRELEEEWAEVVVWAEVRGEEWAWDAAWARVSDAAWT